MEKCLIKFYFQIIQIVDTARDIISDSQSGRCFVPINYFSNNEYKHLVARDPFRVDNKILIECFDKLMFLYDRVLDEIEPSLFLMPKECQFICFSYLDVLRNEGLMLMNDGFYESNRRLNVWVRFFMLLKWLYFPKAINTLKFHTT